MKLVQVEYWLEEDKDDDENSIVYYVDFELASVRRWVNKTVIWAINNHIDILISAVDEVPEGIKMFKPGNRKPHERSKVHTRTN